MSYASKELVYSGTVSTVFVHLPYIQTDALTSLRVAVLTNLDITIDVYWSIDGITALFKDSFSVSSADGVSNNFPVKARYVKITIDNYQFPLTPSVSLQTLLFYKAPQGAIDLENIGAGVQIYKPANQKIRSVISSDSSILLVQNTDVIDIRTFANSVGLQSTGSTYSLLYDDIGPVFKTKTLNGTNITIIDQSTNLLISGDVVNLGSTGGNSLVSDGVGPILSIKGIEGGSFINIVSSDTTIMINKVINTSNYFNAYGESTLSFTAGVFGAPPMNSGTVLNGFSVRGFNQGATCNVLIPHLYSISGGLGINYNSDGYFLILKNGSVIFSLYGSNGVASMFHMSGGAIATLVSGDYVEIGWKPNSASEVNRFVSGAFLTITQLTF